MRDQNFVAQVLQNQDRMDGCFDLKVLAGASVEEDDLSLRARFRKRGVLLEPAFESASICTRHGGITVNTDDLFHRDTNWLHIQRPVCNGCKRSHDGADQAGTTNQLVTKRDPLLLLHVGTRMVDHLSDLHSLRAYQRAGTTGGAVVNRVVNNVAIFAIALSLRPRVLGASEKICHAHDRALRFTDGALHAGIQG